jgi:hypothetical protein
MGPSLANANRSWRLALPARAVWACRKPPGLRDVQCRTKRLFIFQMSRGSSVIAFPAPDWPTTFSV